MIKLTRKIAGKEVELDIISLNGKATLRDDSFAKLEKQGITKSQLKEFSIEADELNKIKSK
jgi:hypothetical protein